MADPLQMAIVEVASVPGGIHRSVLWAAVSARLAEAAPADAPPAPDRVLAALGMCMVRGLVDEVDGCIVGVQGMGAAAG